MNSEHDYDRMICVRASEWQQGADGIRELETLVANRTREGEFHSNRANNLQSLVDYLNKRIEGLEAELAKAGSDIAGFSNLLLESQVRCQKLEAELAKTRIKLGEYAMMADPLTVSLKADNARLRECLKRLIDAHNNDADMDIYDALIAEVAAELEGK
jgi:uncharacterized coiled-coil protein SlyX